MFRAGEFYSPVCLLLLPNVLQHSNTELVWKKQNLSSVFGKNNLKMICKNTFHFYLTTEILLTVFELQFCIHIKKMENVA